MFPKVIVLFSSFKSTKINLPSGSENCFLISNWKLLLNRMHTPALELETLLKIAEKPHSDDHSRSFSLVQWTSWRKNIPNFFILSQRKVSRLLRLLDKPLTLREQIINSSIGNLLMIKSSELECRNKMQITIVNTS